MPLTAKQERIVRAMLAAGEFTVEEIAEASNEPAASVRTNLHRKWKDIVEPVGRDMTGRRGASWQRWRLLPGQAAGILAELEASPSEPPPPPDLMAAEELLLDILGPDLDPPLYEHYLERARELRDSGMAALEACGDTCGPEAGAHAVVVDLLLRLEDARDEADLGALAEELRAQRETLGEGELYESIERRLGERS